MLHRLQASWGPVIVLSILSVVTALVADAQTSPAGKSGGFADLGDGVTGGEGGSVVNASDAAELKKLMKSEEPMIIQIEGRIEIGAMNIGSNKTLLGIGQNAWIEGNLQIDGATNVVVRNLHFSNADRADGISVVDGSKNIWIDHCTVHDCLDGQLDISRRADLVTVSWCRFEYTTSFGHNFSMLIGASDRATSDRGKLRVTLHHNLWGNLAHERMPRVRFGQVHSYNNLFNAPGNNYCMRAALESQILAEKNVFDSVKRPFHVYETSGVPGRIRTSGNLYIETKDVEEFDDEVFAPPYSYTLEDTTDLAASIRTEAGAAK